MKEYIARFGHGSAKLARQAQSKEKTLEKMIQEGLTERVDAEHAVKLTFTNVGKLPPPVLQFSEVAFGYSRDAVRPCCTPVFLPTCVCVCAHSCFCPPLSVCTVKFLPTCVCGHTRVSAHSRRCCHCRDELTMAPSCQGGQRCRC